MKTISFAATLLLAVDAAAALPTGFLDRADRQVIAGWARDPDHPRSLRVHIYVDGVFVADLPANVHRPDVGGNYGFHWTHQRNFGPGVHEIRAYAIGVDAAGSHDHLNKELHHSPRSMEEPRFYTLVSEDGDVEVDVDARFGGAIGRLEDFVYFPGVSLVHGNHGGAALQTAFWYPVGQLSPGCPADRPDMYGMNPTQGGFYADIVAGIHAGNPIGIQGTERTRFDPNEIIRFEDDGRTVHLKSKMIRHDFCASPYATQSLQHLWDTDWYLEQWISFDPRFARTLRVRSRLHHVGASPLLMDTRQLPILFGNHLPRAAYWKNGGKVVTAQKPIQFEPDTAWAAAIGAEVEAGLGMVIHPNADFFRFSTASGLFAFDVVGGVTRLFASGEGHVKLESIGKPSPGVSSPNGGAYYRFPPGATFEWDVYFPIGSLSLIRQQAAAVHEEAFFEGNRPPSVNAGPDRSVVFPGAVQLSATYSDDGLPGGGLTLSWAQVAGPGTATFSSRAVPNPTVHFSKAGEYILRLSVSDGELGSFDELTVFVLAAGTYTPDYASAPDYLPPGYAPSGTIRRLLLANGIRLSIDGSPGTPVAIQSGTTRGFAFAAPPGRLLTRVQFDLVANYDMNLLRAGIDVPGTSFYWSVTALGVRSVTIDLPRVPWLGFHFAVQNGHPGIPFPWLFQVTNVRLTHVQNWGQAVISGPAPMARSSQ